MSGRRAGSTGAGSILREPRGCRCRPSALGWTGLLLGSLPATAYAADAEVTSDSVFQSYDVRSPTGETVLSRRRLTETLGIGAYDLLGAPPGDPHAADISFRARVRYDADYGADNSITNPANTGAYVPGYQNNLVDVMYAYVEGRRLLKGWLGFKLGRQYVTDVLGWWSFDGGEVSATTPYYVKAEAYGGLEQRGGMPLSSTRYESDGVWRGDRSGLDPSLYPQFQPATIAPAFGFALESVGVTWLHGRLTYRRVYDTGTSNLSEFANGLYAPATYSGTRISSERPGYAVDASLGHVVGAKAGVVYDFYNAEVSNLYGSLDGYLGKKLTVSADYDYYVPTFDADSIWNFFAGEPMNDIGLRANVDITDRIAVAGGGQVRIFNVQTSPLNPGNGGAYSPYPNYLPSAVVYPSNGHPFDEGYHLSARYKTSSTTLGLRSSGNWGDEGERVGADVYGEHIFERRYIASLRTGVWQWNDKLQPDRDATSFQYVAGLGYIFAKRDRAMVDWEQDMNRLVGQRFRLMVWLTLAVGK